MKFGWGLIVTDLITLNDASSFVGPGGLTDKTIHEMDLKFGFEFHWSKDRQHFCIVSLFSERIS
jgi:hypothetical protein